MTSPRVLVLENHGFARSVMVKLLQRLGVRDVVQASDGEQALVQMHLSGGVDIVLCDLADKGFDCLEFLSYASQIGMVHAVLLCSELRPELQRTLGQMGSLSGLQLLGVIKQPIQMRALHRMLQRYRVRRPMVEAQVLPRELPSEDEVRRGLALGEFRAWFQPKCVMTTGTIVGAEALVRWEHPAKGVLLPREFLAAVLAYDLIDQMFKQLLEQGLSLLGIVRRQGLSLELSFNLHASQLADSDLVGHIRRALQRHAFQGSTLQFELTENGLLEVSPVTQENLLRLRMLGCGLSIDDFGVGFSSLKLLCQLPFNQLKLDGEFVQRLHEPGCRAMVASTLALARSLEMQLVIEGVSSQRIRDALVALGCEIGQGFHLARPMTGHGLLQWLAAPGDEK
ncbi:MULTISPECIES: EAL domain-containing protein [Pseudomonas]|uniref:EAL domain-containing response regulator n=1 Tax=Pseudomonas wuhanensis TaxID=2954098 RepID=A0ABY9GLS9_9PSED|nr:MULTISPECIES: EAL domain-containing response regulator [unclassified Pseudomonas]WLI10913.1 EAL domain-containing response regulator [Pseudomonas sp. FP603]WLI16740.1 EAL domain-containing response regulator [Pseudomonas sp. FP607]